MVDDILVRAMLYAQLDAIDKPPPDMAGRAGLSAKVIVDVRAAGASR